MCHSQLQRTNGPKVNYCTQYSNDFYQFKGTVLARLLTLSAATEITYSICSKRDYLLCLQQARLLTLPAASVITYSMCSKRDYLLCLQQAG